MNWKNLITIGIIILSAVVVFNWILPHQEISWLKPGTYAKYDVYNVFFVQDRYVDKYKILSVSYNKVVIKHNWLRNDTLYVDVKSRKLLKAITDGQNITNLFIRPPFKSYYFHLWIPTDLSIGDTIKLYECKGDGEEYRIVNISSVKVSGYEREAYVLKAEFGNNRWTGWYDRQTGLLLRWKHENKDEVWYESNLIETNIF